MGRYITIIIMFVVGCYLFLQTYKDVDGFYEYRKTRQAVAMIGRKGTRIMYMLIGICLVVFSILLLFI
ncbi:hypothetical protein NRK67_03875 [Fusobacteria bacterium ZRK30]|nr:hypothetical protein NRK67_03875 [Fusobacteria bacterium ZRK30]